MTTTNDTLLGNLRVDDPDDLAWVRVHPEVLQHAPDWATHVSAHFESDGSVGIGFDGNYGVVQIGMSIIWKAGEIEYPDNGYTDVYFRENEGSIDVDTLNGYARDFTAAANAFSTAAKAGA